MQKDNYFDIDEKYRTYENSKSVIIPVPFDKTTTYGKGSNFGPKAILDATSQVETYDIETQCEPYLCGIYAEKEIKADTSEQMLSQVREMTKLHLKNNKFPIILGGEHSVSIGSMDVVAENFPKLSVLQIDAHADLRADYKGSKYNHACAMHSISKKVPLVQLGIRSLDVDEKEYVKDKKNVFYAHKICDSSNLDWIDDVVKQLTDDVYITIDLDGFDPSVISATGTPEPGGLQWYPVLALLKKVFQTKNIIAADIVELCPPLEPYSSISAFTAAKLLYKLLAYKFYLKK